MQQFYAHGKLLLSGEYAVLKGARALAIPCGFGQELRVWPSESDGISWKSRDYMGQIWFSAQFSPTFEIIESNDADTAAYLQKLLKAAAATGNQQLNRVNLESTLQFPNNWGLGSSSTLVYLIARMMKVDPMELFFKTSVGSGYDVVCAGTSEPIIYQLLKGKPVWRNVPLSEVYQNASFIHLGEKARSHQAVNSFLKRDNDDENIISEISNITDRLQQTTDLHELKELMKTHESLIAELLNVIPVQKKLFSDFSGVVKSLGAWGGDFIMAVGDDIETYFQNLGYREILSWNEMRKGIKDFKAHP